MKLPPRYLRLIVTLYIFIAIGVLLFLCIAIKKMDKNDYLETDILTELGYDKLTLQNVPHILARRYLYRSVAGKQTSAKEIQYRKLIFHENLPAMPSWDDRNLLEMTNKTRYKAFHQQISQTQSIQLVELLNVFAGICEGNDIVYMLYGGSLLGAYRHLGLIPWDDDIDVLVNVTDGHRLKTLMTRQSEYVLESPNNRQWKFYKRRQSSPCTKSQRNKSTTGENAISEKCETINKWPYIDIFLFSENATHIWDNTPMYKSNYVYHKLHIFPLTRSPFEGKLFPIPKCPFTVLSKTYNVDLCVTAIYSHVYEHVKRERQHSVPCKRLFKYFPFVFETKRVNGVYKRLILNNTVLYEHKLVDKSC